MEYSGYKSLLALTLTEGFGQMTIKRCIEMFGGADVALGATVQELASIDRVGTQRARRLRSALDQTLTSTAVQDECERIESHGVRLIAHGDADYPRLLNLIPDPPMLLWVRGRMFEEDALALGMVGSRRCSHYGGEQADRFASLCAQSGLTIVSGGARGIDGAAHRAALRVGGRTLAVIGSGLAQPYPHDHVELFDQIANGSDSSGDETSGGGGGAVISEFPMDTPPNAQNFPRRNRIISGLSLGVLVVEAALRSGALITARLAVEEHSRELMAVPGRVDAKGSAGCNKIIREGWATLVTSPADVLDALGEAGQILKAGLDEPRGETTGSPSPAVGLTASQQQVVDVLKGPSTLDQLVAWTGLPVQQLQAEMTMLEVRGVVSRKGGLYAPKGS